LWKHADLCQDAINADFAAPSDEIAEWIRSAWRADTTTGIYSSQKLDSHLRDLPPDRFTEPLGRYLSSLPLRLARS
jgi:hypothetical protein